MPAKTDISTCTYAIYEHIKVIEGYISTATAQEQDAERKVTIKMSFLISCRDVQYLLSAGKWTSRDDSNVFPFDCCAIAML